ncbi:hypothetical protein GGX14DRAFT_405106 [Mycena pura]|uniref:Uncharacterized protein n=1 Tax=Mycena pura TaxID=153505 RepID=A0AAD6UZW7_9AGAR|nr:hypothetical protein GGX14DRAFT_405106 [Mycena pura]
MITSGGPVFNPVGLTANIEKSPQLNAETYFRLIMICDKPYRSPTTDLQRLIATLPLPQDKVASFRFSQRNCKEIPGSNKPIPSTASFSQPPPCRRLFVFVASAGPPRTIPVPGGPVEATNRPPLALRKPPNPARATRRRMACRIYATGREWIRTNSTRCAAVRSTHSTGPGCASIAMVPTHVLCDACVVRTGWSSGGAVMSECYITRPTSVTESHALLDSGPLSAPEATQDPPPSPGPAPLPSHSSCSTHPSVLEAPGVLPPYSPP